MSPRPTGMTVHSGSLKPLGTKMVINSCLVAAALALLAALASLAGLLTRRRTLSVSAKSSNGSKVKQNVYVLDARLMPLKIAMASRGLGHPETIAILESLIDDETQEDR